MSDNQPAGTPEARATPPGGPGVSVTSPGEERAALLLKSLPGELADAVLGRMLPENATRLRAHMQAAPLAGSPEAQQVLQSFVARVRRAVSPGLGGGERPKDEFLPSPHAKALLSAVATAPVKPSRLLSPGSAGGLSEAEAEAIAEQEPSDEAIQELQQLGAARTAAVLRSERTPVVVAALSCLSMTEASEVLKRLPPERRREATLKLARGGPGDPRLVQRVARAVVRLAQALGDDAGALEGDGQARKLAELLRGLERDDRKEVLEGLTRDDPATAEKVKALLYVFEDLLRIEDRSVQALLAEVEMKTLAQAMNGAEDDLMTKVTNNLSQRARDTLTEEMGLLGKPRAAQIKEARGQVVAVIQRLDSEGKLAMIE
jgi:flagellar motor switch protein FliG